jgi:L-alanine-DL-glutamate epimerase-like enolase superfamily enzyme
LPAQSRVPNIRLIMKITRIEARWIRFPIPSERQHVSDFGQVASFDTALVEITTDNGLVGVGEAENAAGSAGTYRALVALINDEIGPRLIGRDPRDAGPIWDDLYSGVRAHYARSRGHAFPEISRRGLSVAAISGIDIALWDLLGKSLGVPVWRLLGGRKAERMPAYASGGWADAANIGEQLAGYIERGGFRAVKMRVGAMDGEVHVSAARVAAARARLGPGIALMCDAHGTFTVSEAKRFCHMVRDCDIAWLEEPVSPDDKPGQAEVRRYTHIPIASGESEYTRFDFRDLIEHRAVDILQPDLAICGGITEGLRIGALAAAHNLMLIPHLWAGAPAFAAGLHLAATSTASSWLEYSLGANPMLHDLVEESFQVEAGMVAIPERPGLGITLKRQIVDAHTIAHD